jgi:hypothetical protein
MWARATMAAALLLLSCRNDRVADLEGHEQDPLVTAAPTVLIFASIACPLSDRYAPELGRLHERFASRGVEWRLVYVDRDVNQAALRQHAREHLYPFPALHDPRHLLSRRSGATVTPEAALFLDGKLLYRGRIDDRLVDFGKERPVPSRHDLADALEAVLAGRPVPSAETAPLGCAID